MAEAEPYVKGFRHLILDLDKRCTQAKQEVERFRKRVEGYEQLPAVARPLSPERSSSEARLFLGNRLRELAGRKQIRLFSEKRYDIEDLIQDPEKAAQLFRPHAAKECVHPVAARAGQLTIAAFREGILTRPNTLWVALKTERTLSPTAENGARVWTSLVIPCLKDKYGDAFQSGTAAVWAEVHECRVACRLMAKLVQHVHVQRPKRPGRRRVRETREDQRIIEAWKTGVYKTYEALAQEKNVAPQHVRMLVDRDRKRNT